MPQRKNPFIRRVLFALLIAGSVAFTIYYYFFTWRARVPTGSMMNTVIPGDYVLIQKSFGQIERGRIVLFQFPDHPEYPSGEYYLSRVVGLPGETIEMRGNVIYINGSPLDELRVMAKEDSDPLNPLTEVSTEGTGPYRVFYTEHTKDPAVAGSGDFATTSPFQIPNDTFFLLSDNRDNSIDSRFRGPVPREFIWGEPALIYYSKEDFPGGSTRWERILKRVH